MNRRLLRIWAIAIAALPLGACRGGGGYFPAEVATSGAPPLTFGAITAPVGRSAHRELARLGNCGDAPSARLRSAHILLEIRQPDRALTELNSMLYGGIDHGPSVESFARFLRAEAFESRGETDRAAHERELALSSVVDPELREHLSDEPTPDASAPKPPAKLEILPRKLWRARRATKMSPMGRIRRITVHHSALLARSPHPRAAVAAIQGIQRHHQDGREWADIGYHYLIDPAGRIWQGRDIRWQGAHAGDPAKNRGNVGICLLGNFVRRGGQTPTEAQTASLVALIESISNRHGLDHRAIHTHREFKVTSCPGERLQSLVDRIRGFSAPAASH